MPVLPIVDLLILMGGFSLVVGSIFKAISLTTLYRPAILGFSSMDFVLFAGIFFGLALVLVARTWLKLNEPGMLQLQSRLRAEEAHKRAIELEQARGLAAPADAARSEGA